jgi:hypothetical protein
MGSIRRIFFFSFFAACSIFRASAQTTDSTSKFTFNGYVDAYYAYYTDSVGTGNFQKFGTISPRSNQFGLNTLVLTGQYDASKVRAFAAVHFGDIPRVAWSTTYNSIFEAHAGVRLVKNLWLDAGFFRTHLGAEGLLPKENICSSVSVCTIYEAYYEAGARLVYTPNERITIHLYLLNGYNVYEDNNSKKSVGLYVDYKLGDKGDIGYTNYLGDDTPQKADSVAHFRVFQTVFFNYQVKKWKMQLGFDYCFQQHSELTNTAHTASMYSGVLTFKYQARRKAAVYVRGEIFNDPNGVMTATFTDRNGYSTGPTLWGATLGFEYKPTESTYIRLEGRDLIMDPSQEIFRTNGKNVNTRMEYMVNLGVSF